MAVTYGFYNSLNGDRRYNAEQMAMIFDGVIGEGVFHSVGDAFAVAPSSGMVISVGSGRAWFDHTWTYNDAAITLTVSAAPVGSLKRIDAVVIEVDAENRVNSIKMVNGTESATPVRPTLEDYQHPLAYITLEAGVTAITSTMIQSVVGTDTPFVTGPLETVGVTALYNYWRVEFEEWFDHLQDELDENQAAHLQHQIDDINDIGDVAVALGLPSNAKIPDALEVLKDSNLYTWLIYTVRTSTFKESRIQKSSSYLNALFASYRGTGSTTYAVFYAADDYTIDENGHLRLITPVGVTVYIMSTTSGYGIVGADELIGKYFQLKLINPSSNYTFCNSVTNTLWYIEPDDTLFTYTAAVGSNTYYCIGLRKGAIKKEFVSAEENTKNYAPIGIVHDADSDKYPENGIVDGHWYTKITGPANSIYMQDYASPVYYEVFSMNECSDAAYGNGVYVLAYGNLSVVIRDGETLDTNIQSFSISGVAYGNGMFIGINNNNQANYYISEDGVVWSSSLFPSSVRASDIAFGNGAFVVLLGTTNCYVGNGTTWASTTIGVAVYDRIIFENGMFVAMSNTHYIAYSYDGLTWVEINNSDFRTCQDLTFSNGLFISRRSEKTILFSRNGVDWYICGELSAVSMGSLGGIFYYGNKYYCIESYWSSSSYFMYIHYSTDLSRWNHYKVNGRDTYANNPIMINDELYLIRGRNGGPGSSIKLSSGPELFFNGEVVTERVVKMLNGYEV